VEEALVTALAVATARAMSPKMEEFEMRLVESARASVVVERI
jgi:hypothetical protein